MPIIGWNCPHCLDQRAPLDHYAVSDCGLKIHPAYAAAILYDEATDPHGERMSVTDGLGCPRHAAIGNQEAIYVNPLDYNALLIGRGWDTVVGNHEFERWPEAGGWLDGLKLKVQLKGTIAGMEVTGEADNIRRLGDMLILSDWKHSNNFRTKYLKIDAAKEPPEAPSMEYKIQTSIYAELYRQQFGELPTHGEVVYHFSGAGKDVLLPMQYPIMAIGECLAYKPYGGQYTVEELYRMAQPTYAGQKWTELPLVGQTMAFGTKSYCDYCEVKDACLTAARGAPF